MIAQQNDRFRGSNSPNIFIPAINSGHLRQIFLNHTHSDRPLRFTAGLYLRELALAHSLKLLSLKDAPVYLPDKHDLEMCLMGCDAPLSLLVLSLFVRDPRFNEMRDKLRLPQIEGTGLAKKADRYDTQIYCRVFAVNDRLKPNSAEAITAFFDDICERPFFQNEPYFVAGVEISKLLYENVIDAIETMEDKQNQAGSPPAF